MEITLSMHSRLIGLEPLIGRLENKRIDDQFCRYDVFEKIEVKRKDRPQFFISQSSGPEGELVDMDAIEAAPSLTINMEKAELQEVLNCLNDSLPVAFVSWARPLRVEIMDAISKYKDPAAIEFSAKSRLGLQSLLESKPMEKPALQEVKANIHSLIKFNRRERERFIKPLSPKIQWDRIESAPDIQVDFTDKEIDTIKNDILKEHPVSVTDMEWIRGILCQIK